MADYTPNINLEKPVGSENFRRKIINENMDKIDEKFGIGNNSGHVHDGTVGQGKKISFNNLTDKPESYIPSKHKSSHATGGSDPLTPADIGAIPNSFGQIGPEHLMFSGKYGNILAFTPKNRIIYISAGSELFGNPTYPYSAPSFETNMWAINTSSTLPQTMIIDLGRDFYGIQGWSFGGHYITDINSIPKSFTIDTTKDGTNWTRAVTWMYTEKGKLIYNPNTWLPNDDKKAIDTVRWIRFTVIEKSLNAATNDSYCTNVSMLSAYSVSSGIAEQKPLGDSIVETGVSSLGQYAKWNNGFLICLMQMTWPLLNSKDPFYFYFPHSFGNSASYSIHAQQISNLDCIHYFSDFDRHCCCIVIESRNNLPLPRPQVSWHITVIGRWK